MKNKKLFWGCIVGCLIVLAIVAGVILLLNKNKDKEINADAKRFKAEYESVNGTSTVQGKEYFDISIEEDNPIVYKTDEEIIDVLKNENAVVYFGFAKCPWCRNMIEPLLKAAKKENVDKVYYVDILDIRDTYECKDKLKKTKEGTDGYYKILDFFGENLEEYYLTNDKGKKIDTGKTRLYAPTVVTIKKGSIVDMHVGTLDTQKDPYVRLSEDDQEKLQNIFENMIKKISFSGVCDGEDAC